MGRPMNPARAEALQHGETFYLGPPCVHGHMSGLRYASTNACRDCITDRERGRVRPKRAPARDEFETLLTA